MGRALAKLTPEQLAKVNSIVEKTLGNFLNRNYQLKGLNQDIPFGQQWISL
ncbi:hypothetical protein RintRC_4757 [Richelia intracellularis]|nr:hypothetical protein RintRC_4757 [Richelia intracellularis]